MIYKEVLTLTYDYKTFQSLKITLYLEISTATTLKYNFSVTYFFNLRIQQFSYCIKIKCIGLSGIW